MRTFSLRRAALAGLGAALLVSSPALASSASKTIGIYFDRDGTVCHGTIRPGEPAEIYVLAKLPPEDDGLHGAEFRFTGIPREWETYPVANEGALAQGDPFANGVIMAFATCQRPENGVVLLYTVLVLASDEIEDLRFAIAPRIPSSNPNFECSLAVKCDFPSYSLECVSGGACLVNPSRVVDCTSVLPVTPASWSAVKSLYRD